MIKKHFNNEKYKELIPYIEDGVVNEFQGVSTVFVYNEYISKRRTAILAFFVVLLYMVCFDINHDLFSLLSFGGLLTCFLVSAFKCYRYYVTQYQHAKNYVEILFQGFFLKENRDALFEDFKSYIKTINIPDKKVLQIQQELFYENRTYFSLNDKKCSYYYKIASVDALIKNFSYFYKV